MNDSPPIESALEYMLAYHTIAGTVPPFRVIRLVHLRPHVPEYVFGDTSDDPERVMVTDKGALGLDLVRFRDGREAFTAHVSDGAPPNVPAALILAMLGDTWEE